MTVSSPTAAIHADADTQRLGFAPTMTVPGVTLHDSEQAVLVAAMREEATDVPIDEFRMAAVASWHRLEGLLAGRGIGSADLQDHFDDARAATATRYAHQRNRLGELVAAWRDAGVTTTLLKGAALVEAGVVPAGERPMADLDVLVDRAHADRAHAVAADLGFRSTASASTWRYARTRHHQLPALHDDSGTTVEIHHRLFTTSHPQHGLDEFARGRRVPLVDRHPVVTSAAGEPPGPSPGSADAAWTDELTACRLDDVANWLHLAVHFWDDRRRGTGGPLLQLRDLHLLLARIDPARLVVATRQVGAARLVGTVAAVLATVCPSDRATSLRRRLDGPAEVDDKIVDFVRTRILGRRSPLAQLVHPTVDVPYTPWRLLTRARHQLWPGRAEVRRVHGPEARQRDHLASLVPVAIDALRAPATTWHDLRLDRWAHHVVREVR